MIALRGCLIDTQFRTNLSFARMRNVSSCQKSKERFHVRKFLSIFLSRNGSNFIEVHQIRSRMSLKYIQNNTLFRSQTISLYIDRKTEDKPSYLSFKSENSIHSMTFRKRIHQLNPKILEIMIVYTTDIQKVSEKEIPNIVECGHVPPHVSGPTVHVSDMFSGNRLNHLNRSIALSEGESLIDKLPSAFEIDLSQRGIILDELIKFQRPANRR